MVINDALVIFLRQYRIRNKCPGVDPSPHEDRGGLSWEEDVPGQRILVCTVFCPVIGHDVEHDEGQEH